jgi:predicted N-acetyltransferase YhbS
MQTISGATASDLEQASLMMWESYDYVKAKEERDFFYKLLINEPELDPEQLRIVRVDGRIAATVFVARRTMFDGWDNLRLGGIGNVAVHPDFRGKGLSILILQDAVDYMAQIGCHVSTLYSGHVGLYERVGYERLSGRGQVKGRVPGEPVHFQRTKDWSIAEALFAGSISRLPGGMVRSEMYWRRYIAGRWLPSTDIVYSNDYSAYVIIADGGEPETVELLDAGYSDNIEQLENLLRTQFSGLNLSSPSADLANPLLSAINSVVVDASVESSCGLLARTFDGRALPPSFLDMSVDRF